MEERNTDGEYLSINTTLTAWVTESNPVNQSNWTTLDPTFHMKSLIAKFLEFIISLIGLAGNAVVLCILGFRMQKTAFSIYILNLAGADFVYLSIWMIYSMRSFIEGLRSHNIYDSELFIIIIAFPYIASLSILSAISTERCLSVLVPIWYRGHRPKYLSSVICALLWALSLLLGIIRMGFCEFLIGEFYGYLCKLLDFSIATWLILSFVLLFGSSLVLLTRLLCGSQKIKMTRLYKTIGLTILAFLLCGLPWGINWFLLPWMPIKWSNMYNHTMYLTTEILSCVNSCANPIIYFFVGSYRQQLRRQKKSFKLILQKALQDIPEEDGSESRPPQETLDMSGNSHVS
ncbi:mas-related G-protein coupled receptor member X1-like [Suncus etruscus]|uniref:mas-related G-protein coupled receptor member X1-like n=1 Tax=Suncus etruscus TaxID=109475 RepID=UPI0021106070|nr:mas-related G-protein coupled receptor member X1-like [Suncus etruscus]